MTLIHMLCLHTTNCHTHDLVEKNIGIRTKSWKDSNFLLHDFKSKVCIPQKPGLLR